MQGPFIVLGEFKGLFNTRQVAPLGRTEELPVNNTHKVQVYQGTLDQVEFHADFEPDTYRKLRSFILLNVPNVTIRPGQNGPFTGDRLYTFTQLILIDPKILKTYEINGETYGEIASKAYGKTFSEPQLGRLKPDPFDNTGYSMQDQWWRSRYVNDGINGCGTLLNGCIANFWRILGILFLLLLLWGLMKACNSISNDDKACSDAEKARLRKERIKQELDSTRREYDLNLKKALSNISTIYFYQNSTDLHANSSGINGTLDRLSQVMQSYKDKTFFLVGHHAGKIENKLIDSLRAEKVKSLLIQDGVNGSQLITKRRFDKDAKNLPLDDFMDENGIRKYNKNMSVTIEVKK
jgi:hypothetical protein